MTDVEAKARAYLGEGRVRVVSSGGGIADVLVRGTAVYAVQLSGGRWTCTCPARVERCAHIVAATLICGPGDFALVERPSDEQRMVKASDLRAGDVCHIGRSPALTLIYDPVLVSDYLRVYYRHNGTEDSAYVKPTDDVRIVTKADAR